MNEFPERNLTDQYISQSFENLLQYVTASGFNYLTDGLGNQINILNITASYSTTSGGTIDNAITASYAHSASNATSASYAESASWTPFVDTSAFVQTNQTASMSVLTASYSVSSAWAPGSSVIDTSSFVTNDMTASMTVLSSSWALSASWSPGSIDPSNFVQTSQTASMTVLSSSYATTAAFALNNSIIDTSSFVTNVMTSSFLTGDTGSFITNNITASMLSPYLLSTDTSSFATTASNTFIGNQTISGSVYMTGSVKVNDKQGGATNDGDVLTYSRVATAAAGMTATSSITLVGDGTVTILSGSVRFYNNTEFQHYIQRFEMPHSTTLTPTNNAVSYVVADYNSGSPIYRIETDQENLNHSDVHPIYTIYREGTSIYYISWISTARGLPNKLEQRFIRTVRLTRESGLTLSISESRIKVSEGKLWIGATRYSEDAFDSSLNSIQKYYHSASIYTYTTASAFDSWSYDTGTTTASLGPNRYGVRWVYRDVDTSETVNDLDVSTIIGTSNALSLATAQAELAPSTLPARLSAMGILIGRFFVQQGNPNAVLVESAFTQNFTPSLVTDHSSLANLDFGSSGHTGFVPTSGTGSFVLNDYTASMTVLSSSYAQSASTAISASWAPPGDTSMFVQTSLTASMLEPYLLSSNTSSFVTNEMTASMTVLSASYAENAGVVIDTSSFVTNDMTSSFLTGDTSSFVTNEQTASMLESYLLIANTSSFVVNSQTSSFLTGDTSSFVQNSQTASMTVLSASYAENAGVTIDTSSFVTNEMTASFLTGDTSSFVTNDMTASMTVLSASYAPDTTDLTPYLLSANTASFVTNDMTSSMTVLSASYAPFVDDGTYVHNSDTASMTVLSASYAPGSSTLDTSSFIKNEQTTDFTLNASMKINTGSLMIVPVTQSLIDSFTVTEVTSDYVYLYEYAIAPVYNENIQGEIYTATNENSSSLDSSNYFELTWTDLDSSLITGYNIYRKTIEDVITDDCGLIGTVLPGVENFIDSGSAVISPLYLNNDIGRLVFEDHISSSYAMYKDSNGYFHILEENSENNFGYITLGKNISSLALKDSSEGYAIYDCYSLGVSSYVTDNTTEKFMATWMETSSFGWYSDMLDPILISFPRGFVGINYDSLDDDNYHMFSVNGPSVFTGSINVTEAITASFFLGTASWAESTSIAISATYAITTDINTSSFVTNDMTASMTVLSSSYAVSAAWAPPTAVFDTSSFVQNSQTASMTVLSSSYAISSAYAPGNTTIDTGSFATTGSNLFYETQTISGSLNISGTDSNINIENNIKLNVSPTSDLKTSGIIFQLTTGVNVAFGDIGYISSSGVVELANADAIEHCGAVIMCTDATIASGSSGNWLLNGIARNDAWSWTVGSNNFIYVSATGSSGNTLTQTPPTATDSVTQIVGYPLTATSIYFNPQLVQIEHT